MKTFNSIVDKNKKVNYTELAYDAIKKLIMDEEIKQDDLIGENQIAEYLNMSRTPVREAIRRLEAEGVLYAKQGLGTFLCRLSLKDIKDVFEVREALEIIASRTAIRDITDEEAQKLRSEFLELLERHVRGEKIDRMEFSEMDGKIHNLIINSAENEYVKLLLDQINFKVNRYRMISFKVSLDLEESTRQHLDLLDCILERNEEKFTEHIRAHIRWSLKILQENFDYS
ncbi:MAG: GntR family transcriptional regulator, partial [Clostridium sp.]